MPFSVTFFTLPRKPTSLLFIKESVVQGTLTTFSTGKATGSGVKTQDSDLGLPLPGYAVLCQAAFNNAALSDTFSDNEELEVQEVSPMILTHRKVCNYLLSE